MRQDEAAPHLSEEQKNEILLGGEAHLCAAHLRVCEACRKEIAAMQALLGCFGESVRQHGADLQKHFQEEYRIARASQAIAKPSWRERVGIAPASALFKPALAGALLIVLAAALHFTLSPKPGMLSHAQDTQAHTAAAASRNGSAHRDVSAPPVIDPDDLLMQQVAEQLDQSVPASMLPLTAMVTAESPDASRVKEEN